MPPQRASRFHPHSASGPPPQTPNATRDWPALQGMYDVAADTQVAASSTHVIVTTRTTIGMYDRHGNPVQAPIDVGNFFAPLNMRTVLGSTGDPWWFDTRLIYDDHRGVFWIVTLALKYGPGAAHSDQRTKFACAISHSENPLDGFYQYWWDGVVHDGISPDPWGVYQPGDEADYPSLGIDSKCFYSAVGVSDNTTGEDRYCFVLVQDADKLATGQQPPIDFWAFWDLKTPDGNPAMGIRPAIHPDFPSRAYFAGPTWDPANGGVLLWGLDDPLGTRQSLTRATLTVAPFGPNQDGAQSGSTHPIAMGNIGVDPLKVAVRQLPTAHQNPANNETMIIAMNDAQPWNIDGSMLAACRVIQVDLSNWPWWVGPEPVFGTPAGFRERAFGAFNPLEDDPSARFSYGWPSAMLNNFGDMVVVYSRTGETIDPEIRFSVWLADENDIRPSRQLKSGEAPYFVNFDPSHPPAADAEMPWADVAGVSLDPDGNGIWIAHCYADGRTDPSGAGTVNNNYSTHVGLVFGAGYSL